MAGAAWPPVNGSEPPIPPSNDNFASSKAKVSKPLLILVALLTIALVATTIMWASTAAELGEMQSTEAARQSAAAEIPDLRAVADKYFNGVASVNGDADSLSITIDKYEVIEAALPLRQMLTELGFSSAVLDRMDSTRALDGTLSAEGKNCNVTWTYHPDHGLQMVFGSEPSN